MDSAGFLVDKTCFVLIGDNLDYLASTLSSTLFEYAYKKFYSVNLGKTGWSQNKYTILELPIKKTTQNCMLSNEQVFELYGIDSVEQNLISSHHPT